MKFTEVILEQPEFPDSSPASLKLFGHLLLNNLNQRYAYEEADRLDQAVESKLKELGYVDSTV